MSQTGHNPSYQQQWGADRGINPALLSLNSSEWGGIEDIGTPEGQWALSEVLEWLETFKPYGIGAHGREQYVTASVSRLAEKYSSPGLFIEGVDPATGKPSGDRQLRLQRPQKDGPKYLRPKGGVARVFFARVDQFTCRKVAARHGIDEVPSPEGFWEWVKAQKLPLILVEGAGDALGALSRGFVALGLPGHHMAFCPDTRALKPELTWLLENGPEVVIAFDQDTKHKTIRAVNKSRGAVGFALARMGCLVRVASWQPERGKGFGDLSDEDQVRALSKALPFAQWRVEGYTIFTQKPSLEVHQRYLRVEYPRNFLTLVKSAKGTGKTEGLISAVTAAHDEGRRVLLLTHRVQLGQAICDRVGLPYISEVRSAGEGSLLGYGLCVDSLHRNSQARFNAEDWKGALVLIDEIEQLLWHLFNSSTCKSQRGVILPQFVEVLKNAGQVIGLDADLSDITADYLERVTGHQAYTILNTWKPSEDEAWDGYFFNKSIELLQRLDQDLRQQRRCFILTQSQKPKSPYGSINLEKHCLKAWPDARVLRIDADTVADPNHPAFGCIGSLNSLAANYDVVIGSPSIETGVSVDIRGHFEGVYAFLPGQCPENSARQQLSRVREPIPRYIWAATYGSVGILHGGELSPRALLGKLGARAKVALQLLEWDEDGDCLNLNTEALDLWAKMAARLNGGLISFRETLSRNLEAEGHRLHAGGIDSSQPFTPSETLKGDVEETRNESWDEECEAVAASDPITDSEASKLEKKRSLTEKQRRQLRKNKLGKLYGVDVSPNLVKADDEGLYPKLRLQYFLTLGNSHLAQRDKATAETMLESGGGKAWLPDFCGSLYGVKVKVLQALGLEQLIGDLDREFRNGDVDLKAWADRVVGCRQQIKRLLGVGIGPQTPPVRVLKQILGLIGIDLRCVGRDRIDGKVGERVYRIAAPPPLHTAILQAWLAADDLKAAKSDPDPSQTQTPQGIEANSGGEMGDPDPVKDLIYPVRIQTPPPPHSIIVWEGAQWHRRDADGLVWLCPYGADPEDSSHWIHIHPQDLVAA